MQSAYKQYTSGCHMISLLMDLDVQLFDTEGVSQLHYSHYDLSSVLERYKQEALVHILEQSCVKEHVYVFRCSMQLEFLVAEVEDGADDRGTLVIGPCIRKVYHPQVLHEMISKERLSLVIQRELYQCYTMLTMVDEAKQQAISYLLVNLLTPGMRQSQLVETSLPSEDGTGVKFNANLEQDRALVERRYETENTLMHAIAKGDPQVLKHAIEESQGLPCPYRHPTVPMRSMKNLLITANSLFRKAAESAGVHPLFLDSFSGKFATQIEQVQSIAELTSLYEEMPYVYCRLVRDLSVAALPSLVKEGVTLIRINIDQPLSLSRLADILGVHPSYLSSTFKKELGMTLTNYINKLRIEEAKYMLDCGNVSVTKAALSVGHSDSNYFSKVFHRLEQVTQHDYRKRKKGNETSLHRVPLESGKEEESERGPIALGNHSLRVGGQGISQRQLTKGGKQL